MCVWVSADDENAMALHRDGCAHQRCSSTTTGQMLLALTSCRPDLQWGLIDSRSHVHNTAELDLGTVDIEMYSYISDFFWYGR